MKTKDNYYKLNKPILIVIDIISLIFYIEIVMKYIASYNQDHLAGNIFNIFTVATTALIISSTFYFVVYMNKKLILSDKLSGIIELIISSFMFIIINIISDDNGDAYKALFLFAIIRATIRRGLRSGIFTSLISSSFILITGFILKKNYLTSITFNNDIIICIIFIFLACVMGYYVNIDRKYIAKLEDLANKDGLTGLYNHKCFYDKLDQALKINRSKSESISLIFLDIDDFKCYNDLNGHQKGDYALKILSDILKSSVKKNHIVARYDGEEFAIIMQGTHENEAMLWCEKIRLTVEKTKFDGEENQPSGNLTISMGISEYPQKAITSQQLIKTADEALYRAKFFYKNRVETYVSILDNVKDKVSSKDKEVITSIKTLISIINTKDKFTYGHIERVVEYAKLIADKLNLSVSAKETLIYGAYMHDIGKINISKEILIKKMPLTNDEWLELKKHPLFGFDIIKDIQALKDVADIVVHHHERYDGLGYPYGLKGQDIPYLARILTVIDSFDTMTSHRPYNTCKSYEEGKAELIKFSGSQFDPEIAQAFISIIDKTLIKI